MRSPMIWTSGPMDWCREGCREMSVPAEKYVAYYRGILKRISDGWQSPESLASIALGWKLHESGCAFHSGDLGKCTCSTNDARGEAK
jgi:hypothetical protein